MIDAKDYRWATFQCEDCNDVFVGMLPRMEEELPDCPDCSGESRLWEVLVPHRHTT